MIYVLFAKFSILLGTVDCLVLEGPGYAQVTCNSTFVGSVISNCELSGSDIVLEVSCKFIIILSEFF